MITYPEAQRAAEAYWREHGYAAQWAADATGYEDAEDYLVPFRNFDEPDLVLLDDRQIFVRKSDGIAHEEFALSTFDKVDGMTPIARPGRPA